MKRTNKARVKCPKCGSWNVYDTGDRMGDPVSLDHDGSLPEADHPVYKCSRCGEIFILEAGKEKKKR